MLKLPGVGTALSSFFYACFRDWSWNAGTSDNLQNHQCLWGNYSQDAKLRDILGR